MAPSLNRTMDSAGSNQHSTTNMNLSFAGFTNGEIYSSSKWQIIPRTYSTTISVDPECINEVLYHIGALHGPPDNRGTKGLIFRSVIPKATITVYLTTATISVQGSQHSEWIVSLLPEIDQRMDFPMLSANSQPASDSDNVDTSLPIPISSSTPRNSICLSPVPTVTTGTQTLNFCEVACQTSATTTSSVETQTDLCPVTKVHNLSATPDDSPENTLVNDPPAENDNSHSSNDETVTPNIPTSNRFSVLHVQEPSPSSDQSPPRPIPKPRKSIKPVPKPRRNKPVSKPTCIIEPPTQQQPSTPADRTKSASRTILIIGDLDSQTSCRT